jgi:uncharacterized membrane protein
MTRRLLGSYLRYFFNGLIVALTVSYPFLVWFSLDYLQPRQLALALALLFLMRFLFGRSNSNSPLVWLGLFSVLFLLGIAWINQTNRLFAYPVLVSLLFFAVFALSLVYPPTIVERLARFEDPDLPPKGVAYTRKVTQVWSVFFLCNAAVSLATVYLADARIWSLYNGCVFYVLMGLLMAIEMQIRRKVKASY